MTRKIRFIDKSPYKYAALFEPCLNNLYSCRINRKIFNLRSQVVRVATEMYFFLLFNNGEFIFQSDTIFKIIFL